MSDAPSAFKATYSDLKFIKTRKVAQVVLELPIEQSDAFLGVFGAPNPASETWVAIARLDMSKAPEKKVKEKRSFDELPPAQQAAMRCHEGRFWDFLASTHQADINDSDEAAVFVRVECKVASRSELNSDAAAAARWKALNDAYWGWQRGLE